MRRLGGRKAPEYILARARCRQTSSTFHMRLTIWFSTQHLSVRTLTKATSAMEVAFFCSRIQERTVNGQPV